MALAAIDPVRPSGPSDSASDSHTETAQQSKATIILGIKQQIWHSQQSDSASDSHTETAQQSKATIILEIKQQIWHSQQLVLSDQVGLHIQFLILARKRRNKAKQQ